jgi:hypothetical protein
MSATKPQIPGTGLTLGLFGAIVAVSVALFLVWGGWLWAAPRGTSHLGRFVISYLIVLPLAAVALLAVERWSWPHLLAAVGTIWCLKLVVTALLYLALARGTAVRLEPVNLEPSATRARPTEAAYHAAVDGAHGTLAGRLTVAGQPLGDAIVYLDRPPPGRPLSAGRPVELVVEAARYDRPLLLVAARDTVRVHSRDAALHTVHLHEGDRVLGNQPLPSHGALTLPLRRPGLYHITCDNHRQETAWLVVVDHPYAATTGAHGDFQLAAVPAGALTLVAVAVTADGLLRATRALTVAAGAAARMDLTLTPLAPRPLRPTETTPPPGEKENTL